MPTPTRAMLVTDLDGTLLDPRGRVRSRTLAVLHRLGELRVTRVVATGRSPYSFRRAVPADLPIDFAILSSGVGVMEWPGCQTLRQTGLDRAQIETVASALFEMGLDFMLHDPFPANHQFRYHRATRQNTDFEQRIRLYADHASPLPPDLDGFGQAAQFVAIVGSDGQAAVEAVRRRLPGFSTVRTTSPLDHASTWIEIFPPDVQKASATAWLAQRLSVEREDVLGIGNDYNDLDLLHWAGTARVVANAPEDLRQRFAVTASNDEDGVAEAVEGWVGGLAVGSGVS